MLNHLDIKYTVNVIINMNGNDKNNLKMNIHNIKIVGSMFRIPKLR